LTTFLLMEKMKAWWMEKAAQRKKFFKESGRDYFFSSMRRIQKREALLEASLLV